MKNTIKEPILEKYDGRLVLRKENEMDTDYTADYSKKIGLESPADNDKYLQDYTQPVLKMVNKPTIKH